MYWHTGAVFGAVNGLRMGLSETRNMAWSKPRNVQWVLQQRWTNLNAVIKKSVKFTIKKYILKQSASYEMAHKGKSMLGKS